MLISSTATVSNFQEAQEQEVIDIIFGWDKKLRQLERQFNDSYDLTLNQCRILLMIKNKAYIELSYLNKALQVDKSTTTRLVRPLLVNDYIEKFYQFGDKRKIYLRLTEQGEQMIVPIQAQISDIAKTVIRSIPAGKRDFTFLNVKEFLQQLKIS